MRIYVPPRGIAHFRPKKVGTESPAATAAACEPGARAGAPLARPAGMTPPLGERAPASGA